MANTQYGISRIMLCLAFAAWLSEEHGPGHVGAKLIPPANTVVSGSFH